MSTKRQINGTKFNIPEIVDSAIATADSMQLDTERASRALAYLGHRNPDAQTVLRYARESAILNVLARMTGANFNNQIGKIDFSSRESTIAGVDSYLNRRIQGQHANWSASRR